LNNDVFNFNYAQAKVATLAYQEAEEALLLIQNENIKCEYTYISHLVKCCILFFKKTHLIFTDIMNKKPKLAWELYLKMETSGESFSILQMIANDCYKVPFFQKK
jgi:intraflagellar transport protein 56